MTSVAAEAPDAGRDRETSAMATQAQIDRIRTLLSQVAATTDVCASLAVALIETGQPWWNEGFLGRASNPTEYQRARQQILAAATEVFAAARRMRKTMLSPQLILAGAYVTSLCRCCEECPQVNRNRLTERKPFRCLLHERMGGNTPTQFRFRLENGGQIREQQ